MKNRIYITILCVILMLTSCTSVTTSENNTEALNSENDVTDVTESTEESDSLKVRKLIDDELPERDFGGKEYIVLEDTSKREHIEVDESNGEVVNDAIYQRNKLIEERFNVIIKADTIDNYVDLSTYAIKCITAGEDAFDVIGSNVVKSGSLVMNDLLLNWYDIPYVSFEKPWWAKSTSENLTYNGVCMLAVGDFAISSLAYTYCMYFNKELAEDYKINNVYELVSEGKWTIDRLITLTKDIYSDVNNNQRADEQDFYGFCSNASSNANAFLWSFDNPIIANDSNKLFVSFKTEKVGDILVKLVNMFNDNDGISYNLDYVDSEGNKQYPYPRDMFLNSRTIFATGQIEMSIKYFRSMTDDFGIIPYPKWDENQDNYYTMVDGSHSALGVPVTVQNTEMVGIITEALCAESYKSVIPAYYDTALKVKGARDEQSIEILDLIVENRIFDMGYVYDEWKGASFIIQTLVRSNDVNFESYWASKSEAILAQYDKVITYFEQYKQNHQD